MQQTAASTTAETTAEKNARASAETISRLADVAARLRRVRQAQRRFLKLWAEQRAVAWTRDLFWGPDRRDDSHQRMTRVRFRSLDD